MCVRRRRRRYSRDTSIDHRTYASCRTARPTYIVKKPMSTLSRGVPSSHLADTPKFSPGTYMYTEFSHGTYTASSHLFDAHGTYTASSHLFDAHGQGADTEQRYHKCRVSSQYRPVTTHKKCKTILYIQYIQTIYPDIYPVAHVRDVIV